MLCRGVAATLAGLAADTIRTIRPSPSAPTPAEGCSGPARNGGTPEEQTYLLDINLALDNKLLLAF